MATDIERLLRLAADYHNFCFERGENENAGSDPDELSLEELDFIAAAGSSDKCFDGWENTAKNE